jgi:hypothetical protein
LLLTNRFPRAASLILGLVLVVAMLASRNYWENNRFFVCLLFLLAGVSDRRNGARIVQLQIALLYFAAGLNKLLDVDWRSGQYFENLASYAGVGAYGRISDLLPGLLLSATLAWSVIVAEFALSVAFVLRRFVALAIWVGVGYHTSLVLITGRTFGMFWYAATASYIAFVALGPHHVQVSCGWREAACSRLRRAVERLDVEGMVGWRGRTGSGLRVTTETTTYQGFAGLVRLGTALPAVLFMIYVLAALPMLNHRVVAGLILASLTAFGLSVLRSSIEEADFRGKRVFSGRLLKRPGSG